MSQPQSPSAALPLSTYPIDKVILLWRNAELTAEQAIGHLLQHVARLEAQGQALQKALQRLQQVDG